MFTCETLTLVICLAAAATAIRVDWNTNKGPIVPPVPRTDTTVRPQLPYREPAPVWENQSDDIPNPNPYKYVLPPPSRPRASTNNYLTFDRRPVVQDNYVNYNYGKFVLPNQINAYIQNGGKPNSVAALAPKYIPNVGFKYIAVVPNESSSNVKLNTKYLSSPSMPLRSNGAVDGLFSNGIKVQGRYNPKSKKYKAYEKLKFVPFNYYPLYNLAIPDDQYYVADDDPQNWLRNQQLPTLDTVNSFGITTEIPKSKKLHQQPEEAETHTQQPDVESTQNTKYLDAPTKLKKKITFITTKASRSLYPS